ncbi:hypothetical protein DXD76_05330 [Firmicutes bacterium TM09-10]|nr:hypothetical protein DXD76_05330 [Firmicutes bacterium TM09-10]
MIFVAAARGLRALFSVRCAIECVLRVVGCVLRVVGCVLRVVGCVLCVIRRTRASTAICRCVIGHATVRRHIRRIRFLCTVRVFLFAALRRCVVHMLLSGCFFRVVSVTHVVTSFLIRCRIRCVCLLCRQYTE